MSAIPDAVRKALSTAVSAALLLLSSGLEPQACLAQVVQARVQAGAPLSGITVIPGALAKPFLNAGPQARLSTFQLQALPGIEAVRLDADAPAFLVPAAEQRTGLPAAAVAPVLAQAALPLAKAREESGRAQVERLSEELAPQLAAAADLEEAGPESAGSVGVAIESLLTGMRPAPSTDSGLSASPAAAGHARHPGLSLPSGSRTQEGPAAVSETPAPRPAKAELAKAKRGPISRAVSWVKGWLRVLPDRERNRQFWKFLLTQSLVLMGLSFHNTAMPNLAAPQAGQAANMGYARAAGWASQAAANATTGPMIDNMPVQQTLVWVHLARTAALFLVPVLFFQGLLPFGALLGVLFAAGFLESMSYSAEQVAQLRILAGDEKYFNRANAVAGLVHHVVGVVAPLLAGTFIGVMDGLLGPLAGSALSYGVYGVLALAGAMLFKRWLDLPREGVAKARARLRDFLHNARDRYPTVRRAYSAAGESGAVLVIEVSGDPAELKGLPAEFDGYQVKLVSRKTVKDAFAGFAQGFRILWKDRFLRRVCLLFPAVYLFAVDSVLYTALPRVISEALDVSAGAAFFSGIPVLGPMVAALATKAGAFGLFLAAQSLGLGLATLWMMARQGRVGRKAQTHAGPPLERDGKWTSFLHGFGALAYWGIFFLGGLWWSVGAMLLASFLKGPASVAWWSVEQNVIRERYPDDAGKVYSAIFFYSLILSVAGVLVFGLLMETLPIMTAMWIVGGTMTVTAILDFIEPYAVFPASKHRAK
ncbi:MAG: hypothetical protein HY924_10635 [Elusimicrobia bacterium]|nr:hypothetical protein [Elusimicrobiota bacterium]